MALSQAAQTLADNLKSATDLVDSINGQIVSLTNQINVWNSKIGSCKSMSGGSSGHYYCSFDNSDYTNANYAGFLASRQTLQNQVNDLQNNQLPTAKKAVHDAQTAYDNQLVLEQDVNLSPEQKLAKDAAIAKQTNYKTALKWGIIIVAAVVIIGGGIWLYKKYGKSA